MEYARPMTTHIVLLGDSIFDNAPYVNGGPDVIAHLRRMIPPGTKATLLARDGDMTRNVTEQLRHLPSDATHLIVSVGGNDALAEARILSDRVRSIAKALLMLSSVREEFATGNRDMLDAVMRRQRPTAICSIYDGFVNDEVQQRVNVTALSIFNDCITREASRRALPLIDLRVICNEPQDYANPIEPTVHGGAKIARAIVKVVLGSE
jgi:hypothetical protein